ncbi:MAG: hypothetical protein ACFFD4_17100 [Candidatus Odinarchaeota archaeon]
MNGLIEDTEEPQANHRNILKKIELYNKILQLESCLEIYFRLLINGKTTPAELRNKLSQSRATVFRNLALLLEADLITRESDEDVEDKRYMQVYRVKKPLNVFAKIAITKELEEHADRVNKKELLEQWKKILNQLPAIFMNVTTSIFVDQQEKEEGITPVARPVDGVIDKSLPCCKVSMFSVFDNEGEEEIFNLFNEFLKNLNLKKVQEKRNLERPMKDPVALSISLVRFKKSKK